MDFREHIGRKQNENLLPMINVVFLLLIFFLIAARLTAPEPFAVTPPEAHVETEADGKFTLYLSADGQMATQDKTGAAALSFLTEELATYCSRFNCDTAPPNLTLRADAGLKAAQLAALMPELAALGFDQIELVALDVQPGSGAGQ
jgi:biopolymer transport protein ExbD